MGGFRVAAALLLAACGIALVRAALPANSPCAPTQIHISLTGNPTEMRVTWKTAGSSCPSGVTSGPASALSSSPMDPRQLTAHRGSQHSYSSADMCAAPARTFSYSPTYLHTAVLTGLVPRQRHFYQIEGGEPIEFTASVETGPTHRFSFLIFGDMGEGTHRAAKSPGASRTMQLLEDEVGGGAELIMHVGDISYANGREEIWDDFMDEIEPFARHVPYHVAVGNHEYDYERGSNHGAPDPSGETSGYQPEWGNYGNDSGGECGVQISSRFVMPDVSEYGYWTHPRSNSSTDSSTSSSTSSANSTPGGGGSDRRNPTLGPDAAALLSEVLAQQRHAGGSGRDRPSARRLHVAGRTGGGGGGARMQPEAVLQADVALPRANPPFWYSFSYGSVHFVVTSTEHDMRPGSKQYKWLERDLQLVDRCATPWVVLSMHRPMYVVFPHKSNRVVGDHLREQLEQLLDEYRVDLVVSGHVHSYSRTCNVFDEHCVPADKGGMTHIIVGCAGHRLTDISHAQEEWLEYAAVRFGYGRVTVNSGYSMLFELVGDDGVVHDSVKLHNSRASLCGCSYGEGPEADAVHAAAAAAAADATCSGGLGLEGCSPRFGHGAKDGLAATATA